jgi:putative methionine-R-sulfoxide reductase with GAF domain
MVIKEKLVARSPSNPRSGKQLNADDLERDFSAQKFYSSSGHLFGSNSCNFDDSAALSQLKERIAAGDQRLDPLLADIADSACQLTGATGAAIAMWKDGAMVCRARSGDTAPALGARLNTDAGISGECLRTGQIQNCVDTENDPLVDVEVCRRLDLRSIAVLPIQGWRGLNGILEVFSSRPAAFTEQNIALLKELAALAERARTIWPHSASSATPRYPSAFEKRKHSGLLPVSDRVGDVAAALLGARSRSFAFFIALMAISLFVFATWLGWRGAERADDKAHAAASDNKLEISLEFGNPEVEVKDKDKDRDNDKDAPVQIPVNRARDSDPIWNPNPGGEPLFPSNGKPSPGMPLKFAAKVDRIRERKITDERFASDHVQTDRPSVGRTVTHQ